MSADSLPLPPPSHSNALGSIGFAYSSAIVLMEVEDTLREPPAAAVSMKKTVQLG